MEYEYCLLGYQNKCTAEWGLLSFIHMQSQSNEHPLHNPSRTWPSLKALQQCGLFSPTTALKNPLFSTELCLSDLHQALASPRHVMCTSLGAIIYDYSFAWQRVKRALKTVSARTADRSADWDPPLTSWLWSEPWRHQPPPCFVQPLSRRDDAPTLQSSAPWVTMRRQCRLTCYLEYMM